MVKFYVKVCYVIGKALSGELSCMQTGLIFRGRQFICRTTVKPAYVVTSIKGSPVLSSHLFWVP